MGGTVTKLNIYDSSGVVFFFLFGFLVMLDIKIQRNMYGSKYKKKSFVFVFTCYTSPLTKFILHPLIINAYINNISPIETISIFMFHNSIIYLKVDHEDGSI